MKSVEATCGPCGCDAMLDRWGRDRQKEQRELLRSLSADIRRESDLRRLEAVRRGCVRGCDGDPHCPCRPAEVRGNQWSLETYRERTGRPALEVLAGRSDADRLALLRVSL